MDQTLEEVVKHCSQQLDSYQRCIENNPQDWGVACLKFRSELNKCAEENVTELKRVKAKCSSVIAAFDNCLQKNQKDPEKCIKELKQLYHCTEEAAGRKLSSPPPEIVDNKKFIDLSTFQIQSAPPSAYYIEEYISVDEEKLLLDKVYAAPKPKWVTLKNRRLQNWGGIPKDRGMLSEPLPSWLTEPVFPRLAFLKVFDKCAAHKLPNHCLVNEYISGQGIMPHEDGPSYYPTVATVSLGSHTVLDFYNHRYQNADKGNMDSNSLVFSLLIKPRSLLVLQDDLYKSYLHGIEERSKDVLSEKNIINAVEDVGDLERGTRVSLTFRIVEKVIKASLFNRRT
ncbi:5944_t:CDS:2 [Paraglomus brasilianum]|uniref:5944_t:CDS:1 n=1 Tax=Paraglomus brasilianum TaxID=144538 RepID=A0A9N8ZDN9_9GLOM|nr:5944_t:CDS:2 [Paraglomus brasilianum]